MAIKPNLLVQIPTQKDSFSQSGLHSHCFVRLETNYSPIVTRERSNQQTYQSLMAFKSQAEVAKFYADLSTDCTDLLDKRAMVVQAAEIQQCLQLVKKCHPKSVQEALVFLAKYLWKVY